MILDRLTPFREDGHEDLIFDPKAMSLGVEQNNGTENISRIRK